ncbi:VOC family protein [Litorilituus sediminis]|uniref:VOC family protein n=1 Tax=Litorilituus sediminis TaxID=718192 RepID=A0A4P6P7W2_9GAMM|nr:VOC family protein [Litorilituus sediminis]QBG37168.1 VOC family protein [Litorilituus sediminis]
MMEIVGIDHIVLRTNKLSEMIHFYCHILGCTLERKTENAIGLTQLRAGSALIDLVEVDSELGRQGGGAPSITENNMDHFCLQLKATSVDELSRHLLFHNIDVGKFEQRYGAQGYGKSLYIKDPQGNTVELKPQC